ncbi:putative RNA helicase aquarius [Blattamonas nauphoetae]|uniref:RNA helicase aquarius n=1 Tax=Blattamonas nauphoetae TaxID=2049346 RepID=A0ABQ9XKA5_9EUKA|nr:putative RNA helicase aquarius [Blattamonas nauphoetae]
MGHGSKTHNLNNCYSKEGRVDNMLFRRLHCLELVKALANTLSNSHRNLCLVHTCSVSVRMCLAHAKVIAMTTTHTSFAREDLVKQGFSFDSIVLEVTGSCLEIESFIPLVMLKNVDRLKRIVFIGDSRKERPTVQNAALRIGAGFGQSLYHRLLRLHVPFLPLIPQGLCKPSISHKSDQRTQNDFQSW